MRLTTLLALTLVPLTSSLLAEGTSASSRDDSSWTLFFDNDVAGGTDRYYTNGYRFAHLSENLTLNELPFIQRKVASVLPDVFAKSDAIYNTGYSFGQSLFTPSNIETATLNPNDRPYAAWLYFGTSIQAKTQNRLDMLELSLGVIGPAAGGQQVQNAVHDLLGIDRALGWDNQLDNELTVNLFYQKKWRQKYNISRSKSNTPWQISLHQNMGLSLGTVYTGMNAGSAIRFGKRLPDDFGSNRISPTAYVQPTPHGTEAEYRGWGWYVFAGVDLQYRAHNAFLDGGYFKDGPSVDKERFLIEGEAGIAITKGSWRITYTHVVRSKEFERQLSSLQEFGTLAMSYRF